jgi:hypothetical protein
MEPKFKVGDKVYCMEILMEVVMVQQIISKTQKMVHYQCRSLQRDGFSNKQMFLENELSLYDLNRKMEYA